MQTLDEVIGMMDRNTAALKSGQTPNRPFLFIKTPRTASDSMDYEFVHAVRNYVKIGHAKLVRDFYSRPDDLTISLSHNHTPIAAMRRAGIMPESSYQARFKFASVRNPWDRLVSFWRLRSCKGTSGSIAKQSSTFADFVNSLPQYLQFNPYSRHYFQVQPQWRFLQPDYDMILRFEHLQDDWATLTKMLDMNIKLSVRLSLHGSVSTDRIGYERFYTPQLAQTVRSLYRVDCELFGYESVGCQSPFDSQTILGNLKSIWGDA